MTQAVLAHCMSFLSSSPTTPSLSQSRVTLQQWFLHFGGSVSVHWWMRASLLLSNISLENTELGMRKHVSSGTLTQAQNHITATKGFWDKAGSHHPVWSLCRGARLHLHISSNSWAVCWVEGPWDVVQELANSKVEPKLSGEVNKWAWCISMK